VQITCMIGRLGDLGDLFSAVGIQPFSPVHGGAAVQGKSARTTLGA